MAVDIIREEQTASLPIVTVACESEEELSAINVSGWGTGSKAYVMDDTDGVSEYMLSPSGSWCMSAKAPNATDGEET